MLFRQRTAYISHRKFVTGSSRVAHFLFAGSYARYSLGLHVTDQSSVKFSLLACYGLQQSCDGFVAEAVHDCSGRRELFAISRTQKAAAHAGLLGRCA